MPEPISTTTAVAAATVAADKLTATATKTLALMEAINPAWAGKRRDNAELEVWENRLALIQKVKKKIKEVGLDVADCVPPLSFIQPLMEAASLEHDDYLREGWANLTANSLNSKSGVEPRNGYVAVFRQLTQLDCLVMKTIYELNITKSTAAIATKNLPDRAHEMSESETPEGDPSSRVITSLGNLIRLGCLSSSGFWDGGVMVSIVNRTPFGEDFYKACTLQIPAGSS